MKKLLGAAADAYAALYAGFSWAVPEYFSLAEACCARWARNTPDALAIIFEGDGGCRAQYSFGQLQRAANRLSNALQRRGVQRGDRVAILLPQRFETAVAHIGINQLGAVALPLSHMLGAPALGFRLRDSGAVLAIADESGMPLLQALQPSCPALRELIAVGGQPQGEREACWMHALQAEPARFAAVQTRADEPALLIYSSGTTDASGDAKGVLVPQRALIGNLSGFVASQNWFGFDPADAGKKSDALFWSPADWASAGGLMNALLPTLYFGRPIVAHQGRFAPGKAFELMQRHGVTHTVLAPADLEAMRKALPQPAKRYALKLQAIVSASEWGEARGPVCALGEEVFAYCQSQLGVAVNEVFGPAEIRYVLGSCSRLWPARPGSMGRALPGHRVAVIDEAGQICASGVSGEVAVHRCDMRGAPDPAFFLGYWGDQLATQAQFAGDPADSWCRTGVRARLDADGYFFYEGRSGDRCKSSERAVQGQALHCLTSGGKQQRLVPRLKPQALAA
ncbi:AMP-binding protein [Paucibacter sp. TC2R-5]|uniref:acyl-CoA synthetase n=1 Tax=Paucibacter sp. TC2R-5 TaxID=2893555 RepID=UPI0021E46880|nr:AMP-binding protein [Paucibacter sp. TC2R-5]MCV2357594.1 AMP-binding protein [Paucibacter sp. TC2R-5]